jgi:hypothetical protein
VSFAQERALFDDLAMGFFVERFVDARHDMARGYTRIGVKPNVVVGLHLVDHREIVVGILSNVKDDGLFESGDIYVFVFHRIQVMVPM